jgi:hypothetical protein
MDKQTIDNELKQTIQTWAESTFTNDFLREIQTIIQCLEETKKT